MYPLFSSNFKNPLIKFSDVLGLLGLKSIILSVINSFIGSINTTNNISIITSIYIIKLLVFFLCVEITCSSIGAASIGATSGIAGISGIGVSGVGCTVGAATVCG